MLRLLASILLLIALPCQAAYGAEPAPLDRMLGAMLMLGFRGATLPANDTFRQMVSEGKIGNVILFDRDVASGKERNIASPEQLKALTTSLRQAASGPIFISIDQEGGQVRRLKPQKGFLELPSAQAMGQGSPAATLELAQKAGQEMHDLGINMDLAPVVDVDSNPFNPAIGRLGRAYGSDAANVAAHALAFGQGLAKNGVVPVLKHFPGQGCASADSHLGLTDITQCWNAETDLKPYADIFRQGWPGAVMVGHLFQGNLDAALPATLSKNIVTGLLRQGLGWQGVVISDDIQMKSISEGRELKDVMAQAIEAGIDILILGNNLEWDPELPAKAWAAIRALVDEGRLTEARIAESWQRIAELHAAYGN